ncbi:MAG: hypothetical protein R6V61_02290 [Wenzhouxiangellaceae bacterium]
MDTDVKGGNFSGLMISPGVEGTDLGFWGFDFQSKKRFLICVNLCNLWIALRKLWTAFPGTST